MRKLQFVVHGALLAGAAVIAACSSKNKAATAPSPELFGTYAFEARVSAPSNTGVPMMIQGVVHVLADTVILDTGACRSTSMASGGVDSFRYQCPDYALSFGREDPVKNAYYYVNATVTDTKIVCASYATDATGKEYCVKNTREPVERPIMLSGRLTMRKLKPGEREP